MLAGCTAAAITAIATLVDRLWMLNAGAAIPPARREYELARSRGSRRAYLRQQPGGKAIAAMPTCCRLGLRKGRCSPSSASSASWVIQNGPPPPGTDQWWQPEKYISHPCMQAGLASLSGSKGRTSLHLGCVPAVSAGGRDDSCTEFTYTHTSF